MDDPSIRKRKSTLKACVRCHRRKQRCVGYPRCTNCQASRATCLRDASAVSRRFAGLSKQELIEKLEVLVPDGEPFDDRFAQSTSSPDHPVRDVHQHRDGELEAGSTMPKHPNDQHVSPCSATDTSHPSRPTPNNAACDKEVTPHGQSDILQPGNAHIKMAPPPDDALGEELLTAYLENMHRRTAYLDFADILDMHARRHGDFLSDAQSSYDGFKLYMVYAIAATVMQVTRPYASTVPERYFATALHFQSAWEGEEPVRDIEAILLKIYYKLRTSLDSRIWYMVGLAMRTAIDAGMHREYSYRNLDPKTASARRRIFWTVYSLERRVAWSLRRPFSLADYDIDTEEATASDYYVPDSITSLQLRDSPSRRYSVAAPSQLSASMAVFRLTRIMSRVYVDISRVGKPISELKEGVPVQLALLRQFETTLPNVPERDRDWVRLHYEDSVRHVIEPFLRILQPHDELMQICLQASGRMCRLFQRSRMRTLSAYSFMMINSFFIAGMNICYILFKSPSLWRPAIANDLRACSSTLFVMAETNPSLRKYRDVLENIINCTMEHIDQVSRLEPTGVCPCANCSPGTNSEHGEEGRPAFHQLGGTFARLNFEFPSQSYPEYTVGADRAGRTRIAAGSTNERLSSSSTEDPGATGLSTDFTHAPFQGFTQHSPISYSRVPGYGQDMDNFLLPDLWDFSGMDGGAVSSFMPGEPFMQQTMDGFLLRGAQRERLAFP